MAKITFSSLGLKPNKEVNVFEFNGKDIEVLKYLDFSNKYDLIMVALQKSEEDGIYNELKLDMYFHLYLVYMYCNITFTDKQREDEVKLYDLLAGNGFFNEFLGAMVEEEYSTLLNMLAEIRDSKIGYKSTTASIINKFINDMPKAAENAVEIINNFNPENFAQVKNLVDFAAAAGNRTN